MESSLQPSTDILNSQLYSQAAFMCSQDGLQSTTRTALPGCARPGPPTHRPLSSLTLLHQWIYELYSLLPMPTSYTA